jgi:hypothetical protein|tara:strand:- start:5828 stop:5944 length:117 start_codon:yes stop_codon:yes gene_type:complete
MRNAIKIINLIPNTIEAAETVLIKKVGYEKRDIRVILL